MNKLAKKRGGETFSFLLVSKEVVLYQRDFNNKAYKETQVMAINKIISDLK